MNTKRTRLARAYAPIKMRVNDEIPHPNKDWVAFNAEDRTLLYRYLSEEAIERLRETCSFAGAMYHHFRANPIRYADERAFLNDVAVAAEQLLECFSDGSRDGMRLTGIIEAGSNSHRGHPDTDELRRLLRVLADGCRRHVARAPRQAFRHTPEYEVRWIARSVEPQGIKPSAAPGSKFTRIVRTCFQAMGIHLDPGRAIRSYITHKDDDPLRF